MTSIPQQIKKLNLKIKYLTLELEEVKETFRDYENEWREYLISMEQTHKIEIFPKKNIKNKKKSKKVSDHELIDLKRDRKQDEIFKSLYRDVAKVAHPDKTGDDPDTTRLMRQATRAKNTDDLATLLDICDILEIEAPNLEDKHIKLIEKNIKKREEEINRFKNMDAWTYGAGDDTIRERIEKAILAKYKQ